MSEQERGRITRAAQRALLVYPGPVGRLISDELFAYADFSFLWVSGSTTRRINGVVEDVLGRAVPART